MNTAPQAAAPDDPRLAAALDDYLAALRRGEAVDRQALLARYPDLAGELRECLDCLDLIEQAARPAPQGPARADGMTAGVLGDFRLLREVGRGGMGVVYEAEQVSLGRRVALKVLPFAATLDPRQLQRFHNEARAAASLHHEHIVPVYAVGCERGVHFYAMQFIDGRTLADLVAELRRAAVPDTAAASPGAEGGADFVLGAGRPFPPEPTGPYTPPPPAPGAPTAPGVTPPAAGLSTARPGQDAAFFRRAAEWGIQAAEALEHAHALGVIHRDVKPSNLLIDGQGRLWVTDFGLAQVQADSGLTMTGDLVGTLRYMSPEQALARRGLTDHRTDVYSLGVTLYELLALRPAFLGSDRQELLHQIASEEPVAPRRLSRGVPRDLETIVLKAMAKEPGERYQAAQELADDLRRFLNDEPIRARRPTVVQRLRKWIRRHRAVVGTAAAGFLVALAVAASSMGWIVRDLAAQKAQHGDEAQQALQEVDALYADKRWPEALEVARRGERLLASGRGDPDLLQQVQERLRDLQMVSDLEEIRARESATFEFALTDEAFARAFQQYGIDVENLEPAEAAERIRARSVSVELAAAVDYWALRRRERDREAGAEEWQRLVHVARLADPDKRRQQIRDALLKCDQEILQQLAADPKTLELPASTLDLLGKALHDLVGPKPAAVFLRAAQFCYPNDFWINHRLAWCLKDIPRQRDAVRFYTVAVGLRPRSAAAWVNLGAALHETGACDDAIVALQTALRLNPKEGTAHNNLGNALAHKGNYDGAIAAYEKAAALLPKYADPHVNLGNVLTKKGDFDGAIAECEKAIRLQPRSIEARGNLGLALAHKGAYQKAAAAHREAIALAEKRARRIPRYRFQVAFQIGNLAKVYPGEARPEMEQALRRAARIGHQLEREDPQEAGYRDLLGMTYNNLGLLLRRRGQSAEAEKALQEALRYSELAVESGSTPGRRFWLATSYINLASQFKADGRRTEAEKVIERGAQLLQDLVKDYPAIPRFKEGLAMTHFNRGLLFEMDRPADAEKELMEAVEIFKELAKHGDAPEYREGLGSSYNSLGRLLTRGGGRAEAAEQWLRQAQKLLEPLVKNHPDVPTYRKSLAVNCNNLAILLGKDKQRGAEAEQFERKSLEHYRQLEHDNPKVPDYKSGVAGALHNVAFDLRRRHQLGEARQHMEEAIKLQQAALDAVGGRNRRYREDLRDHYWGLTEILLDEKDHARAAMVVENLPRLFPDGWEEYIRAVPLLANCAVLAEKDARLSPEERKRHYSTYVGRIKELLGTAAQHIAAADPRTAEARQNLAAASVKVGTYYADLHEWATARQNFEKAMALQPTLAEAHYKLGDMLYCQRLLPQAAAAYGKAIAHRHDYAEAHEGLAIVLDAQGKTEAAVAAYRTASKLHTDKAKAAAVQINLGSCLARHRRLPEAEQEYRRAIELQPRRATAHYGLGRALSEQGKNQQAIPSFRAAIDIKPDYAAAHECLAFSLDALGRTGEAAAAYRAAGKFYTDKADAARVQVNLGTCLARDGQLPQAEKEFRRAIVLQPKRADAHFSLGLVLVQQGKHPEAIPSFRTAIDLQPDFAKAWGSLGLTLQREGEFADALKALQRSRDLLPPDDPNRRTMEHYVNRCKRIIDLDRKLAEIQKGTTKPEGAGERVELAQVCAARKLYRAAARFYEDAFKEEPQLARGFRYDAACAAALAGDGKGKDDPPLNDTARTSWRNQALAWLKADLELWGRQVKGGPPAARTAAVRRLAQWQLDPALSSVRGSAIADLPEAEREAWRQLWADVGILLARVKPPTKEGAPQKP